MKKIMYGMILLLLPSSGIFASSMLQSFSDWKANRSARADTTKALAQSSEEDNHSLFGIFAEKYLVPSGLYSANTAGRIATLGNNNGACEEAYAARQKSVQTIAASFQPYRFTAERIEYLDPVELLRLLLAARKVLADSGDGTFAKLQEDITKKYQDDATLLETENAETLKARSAVDRELTVVISYLTGLQIISSDVGSLTMDQINTLIASCNNFDKALQAASTANPFYVTLLAPQIDLTLAGRYDPTTADINDEAKRYAAFWKLDSNDLHALGEKLTSMTSGILNQLTAASRILEEELNGSLALNNRIKDIQETLFASGVLVTQGRIMAIDVRNQCVQATKILVQMLQTCRKRMTFESASGDETTTNIAVNMFTPLLSDGQCDPSAFSTPNICQTLRNIAVHAKEDAKFYGTYSDNYAFPKKKSRLWIPRFGKSEIDIVQGTMNKFEEDTQEQNPKTPSIPSAQATVAFCIQCIPETALLDEIGLLANQLGFYSLLATSFTTKSTFNYRTMVLTKFPYTDPAGGGKNPTADKWAPGADLSAATADTAALLLAGEAEDEPAKLTAVSAPEPAKYPIMLGTTPCTLTVKDNSGSHVTGITEVWSEAATTADEITLYLTQGAGTFVETSATKSPSTNHYSASGVSMETATADVAQKGKNILGSAEESRGGTGES